MCDSDGIDLLSSPQEHRVRTRHGLLSVSVYGDEDKPALVTYPDVALNRECLPCLYQIPR
jgi:hypothetical protein